MKSDNYFESPHGGRPPSDHAVKKATFRYVLRGFTEGIRPSATWRAKHSIHSITLAKSVLYAQHGSIELGYNTPRTLCTYCGADEKYFTKCSDPLCINDL